MDDVISVQKTNSANSLSKIKEILSQISNIHFENDKILQKLENNGTRHAELLQEVSALKDEFEVEKHKFENKIKEFEEHNRLLQNLREDKQNLEISFKESEIKYKTMKKTKPSLHDEQLLECGKRKHKLYKEFTGIRWDYSAPESMIEGYITNKKDYLENISYKSDIDYKSLKESLWTSIYKSTTGTMLTEEFKENKPINK